MAPRVHRCFTSFCRTANGCTRTLPGPNQTSSRPRRNVRTRNVLASIAACVVAVAAAAQNPQAPVGPPGGGGFIAYPQRPVTDPNAVARGKVLFDVNCSFCHGADARGGDDGPNLLRSDLVLEDKNGESIGPVVLNGRDRGMPKFTFTAPQISDVAAYIHSFPVSSRTGPANINIVVGNAKAGETFFNAKC